MKFMYGTMNYCIVAICKRFKLWKLFAVVFLNTDENVSKHLIVPFSVSWKNFCSNVNCGSSLAKWNNPLKDFLRNFKCIIFALR